MTELIYSSNPVKNAGDRQVINPRDYEKPVKGVRAVYCDGRDLKVYYGYMTAGVEVLPLSKLPKPTKRSRKGD